MWLDHRSGKYISIEYPLFEYVYAPYRGIFVSCTQRVTSKEGRRIQCL